MSGQNDNTASAAPESSASRRSFVTTATGVAMGGALVAGYGTFFAYAGRFLYPAEPPPKRWLFVARVADMQVGDSMTYRAPTGATIAVARQGDEGTVDDFIALSSVCPHLGCQVHWEGHNDRFFCPCHNGVFDPQGAPVSGPPADADQALPRYPLKIEDGLLYIEVELETLAHACPARSQGAEGDAASDIDTSGQTLTDTEGDIC